MDGFEIWQRPSSVPVPTVWSRYESEKPMSNGKRPIFRIQDYTEDWKDQVMENLRNFYLRDEPLSCGIDILSDESATEEYMKAAEEFFRRKMGLIAIVENLDELGDESLPRLAGCNLTGVVKKNEPELKLETAKIRAILAFVDAVHEKKNAWEHFQVTEYLYAHGLSVHPSFRGHGLCYRILMARFPLCKAVGIKATVTVFTSVLSQKAAKKAGFETLAEIRYDEWKDENGDKIFKVDSPPSILLMGIGIP